MYRKCYKISRIIKVRNDRFWAGFGNLTEEEKTRVHPVREVSVYLVAWLVFMDTFLLVASLVLWASELGAGIFFASLIAGVYSWLNSIGKPHLGLVVR
jgi:hypothetical protein